MGKKLAIKGHSTRGNEVIGLLKMVGGKNKWFYDGSDGFVYFIEKNDKYITFCGKECIKNTGEYIIYELEEFFEQYPYKLNDLVLCDDGLLGVVTKMEWDCEKSDMKYYISFKIPVDNKWYSSKNIKCKFMAAKGKKLAILGHKTRGHEVIELLKIMGGKICAFDYDSDGYAYYIDTSNDMIICSNENTIKHNLDKYQLFTLEEFWEKYPFKVGDKVIDEADGCPGVVCEMKWDEGLSDMKYCVAFGNGIDFGWFANDSINYFKIKKIENLEESQSKRDIDKVVDNLEKTTVKNHKMGPKSKLPSKYYEDKLEEIQSKRECDELRMPINDNENKFPSFEPMFKLNDELEYKIPDGYEITEVSKDKVFIKPIKSKYPTTYEECYDEGNTELHFIYVDKDERDLYESFIQLIRCRTAYWKIAGEEMGLDNPWEPDYLKDANTIRYAIYNTGDEIVKLDGKLYRNYILCFPTEEMRDAFFKNFKDLIEQCKELL